MLMSSCGGDDDPGEALAVSDGIAVVDAWVRPTPPTADEAAIYVTVENRDAPATAIIGATSPACMVVLPHATMIDDEGVSSMGEALDEQLALPEGAAVMMEPLGLHLMCLGLAEPLVAGSSIEVSIELSGRAPVAVAAAVEQR